MLGSSSVKMPPGRVQHEARRVWEPPRPDVTPRQAGQGQRPGSFGVTMTAGPGGESGAPAPFRGWRGSPAVPRAAPPTSLGVLVPSPPAAWRTTGSDEEREQVSPGGDACPVLARPPSPASRYGRASTWDPTCLPGATFFPSPIRLILFSKQHLLCRRYFPWPLTCVRLAAALGRHSVLKRALRGGPHAPRRICQAVASGELVSFQIRRVRQPAAGVEAISREIFT